MDSIINIIKSIRDHYGSSFVLVSLKTISTILFFIVVIGILPDLTLRSRVLLSIWVCSHVAIIMLISISVRDKRNLKWMLICTFIFLMLADGIDLYIIIFSLDGQYGGVTIADYPSLAWLFSFGLIDLMTSVFILVFSRKDLSLILSDGTIKHLREEYHQLITYNLIINNTRIVINDTWPIIRELNQKMVNLQDCINSPEVMNSILIIFLNKIKSSMKLDSNPNRENSSKMNNLDKESCISVPAQSPNSDAPADVSSPEPNKYDRFLGLDVEPRLELNKIEGKSDGVQEDDVKDDLIRVDEIDSAFTAIFRLCLQRFYSSDPDVLNKYKMLIVDEIRDINKLLLNRQYHKKFVITVFCGKFLVK
jgi:hypothetical protein